MAVVGWIARAHGMRGQVIVNEETDLRGERFGPGAELFIDRAGVVEAVVVTSSRLQSGRPVIGFAGVATIDAAEALAGCELRVPIERLIPLPEGTYYRHDLVGCSVETRDGRSVGT